MVWLEFLRRLAHGMRPSPGEVFPVFRICCASPRPRRCGRRYGLSSEWRISDCNRFRKKNDLPSDRSDESCTGCLMSNCRYTRSTDISAWASLQPCGASERTSKKNSKNLNTSQPHVPPGRNKLLEISSTPFSDVLVGRRPCTRPRVVRLQSE